MTSYQRTASGHVMTVHAPPRGELDPAALGAFAAAEPVLGLDVETTALDDRGPRWFAPGFTVRLVQFGTEREAWVLDMADPGQRDAAAAVLADPARRFVTHTPFDVLAVWSALGIALGQRVTDTHLLSKLLDPDERAGHGLKQLAARHLDGGLGDAETALHAQMRALAPAGHRAGNAWLRWGWNHLPADDEHYVVYAGLDAIYARRLLPVLLTACGPFAHLARLDTWLAAQATGITVRGLRLDTAYTRALLADLDAEHAAADAQIAAALGCPGGSPKFADWLDTQATAAGITGLPRTPGGRLQVTADALAALLDRHAAALPAEAAGLARARLAMSKASNLIANLRGFLAAADPGGRVHPQVNTLRAKTARMSVTGPALQTLKKHDPRLRRCFTADLGHVLISCDFSQVEVRVAAALAGDATLRQVIDSGADIHDATARLMYGAAFTDEQRTISKRATFGTIYGGGARALAAQTGVTEDTARQVIARWRRTYPQVIAYGRRLADLPVVVTASGRRIPADPARPYANANYAVQSTARDLLLAAVYTLVTGYGVGGLWLFVHDEIIVQAPDHDAERVRGLLEQAMTSTFRGLPIAAEAKILGPSWGQQDPAAPAPRKSGTCGTSGTRAGQQAHGGFRPVAEVPEPPEPAEPRPAPRRVLVTGSARHFTPQEPAMPSAAAPSTPLLDAALACASRGWHVFPVRPRAKRPPAFPAHNAAGCTGTDPRCRGGHTGWEPRATTDPARIRRAWAAEPYNIGIACGPSGLIVLDLDTPKPGEVPPPEWAMPGITSGADVLAVLCERHGQPFPWETFTVRTGRGGIHLYFTAPPGLRVGNTAGEHGRGLGWLIDTRAHGGYVIAPGSAVDLPGGGTGRYQTGYDRPPAVLPHWLAALLTAPAHNPPPACRPAGAGQVRDLDTWTATALRGEMERVRGAAVGGRNHALNVAAFHLGQLIAAAALPEDMARAGLLDAASVHFGVGEPPFTDAYARDVITAGIAAGKRKPRPLAALGAARVNPASRDGAAALDDVRAFIGRFCVLPTEHAYTAATLWAAHAHALDAFDSTPRLAFLSPEPGSGKTRALEILDLLVPWPMLAVNATPAALFRSVADKATRRTILFDEIDTIFGPKAKEHEELRGLLNAGHRRSGVAYRCVGEGTKQAVVEFPAFAAVALAGLGKLPDTILTRSIVIRMRRRAPGEHVEPYRARIHEPEGWKLRGMLADWTATIAEQLTGYWPDMPPGVTDRPADVWEALLAIADAAGGDWPGRAREACTFLVRDNADRGISLGIRLLADLRDIFDSARAMTTEDILTRLHALDAAPWADLKGAPLDARGLARLLDDYDITSKKVKVNGRSAWGYRAEHLTDAWTRYVPSPALAEAEPAEPPEPEPPP